MNPDPAQVMHILAAVLVFYAVLFLVFMTAIIIPFWFICKKAGFSPWLAFLNIIPTFGTLILLYVLAFADWKTIAPQQPWVPQPFPPQPPAV
jgi:type II secretory pathway component PulF